MNPGKMNCTQVTLASNCFSVTVDGNVQEDAMPRQEEKLIFAGDISYSSFPPNAFFSRGVFVDEERYRQLLYYVARNKENVRNARLQQQRVILSMEQQLIQLREENKRLKKSVIIDTEVPPSSPTEQHGGSAALSGNWRDAIQRMEAI